MRRWVRLAPLVALSLFAVSVAMRSGDPARLDPARSYLPPSLAYPFGCGEGGGDLFLGVAHALVGGLFLGVLVSAVGLGVGTPLGAIAAMRGGRLEGIVRAAADLVQSFPTFLLALSVLSAVREPSRMHLAFVFSLTAWAPYARLALAETVTLRSAGYIEASSALGRTLCGVVFRHVLMQLVPVAGVQFGASAASVVLSEAALGFLGFESRTSVTLGSILAQGVQAMLRAPHVLLIGSLFVFWSSASLLLLGTLASSGGLHEISTRRSTKSGASRG